MSLRMSPLHIVKSKSSKLIYVNKRGVLMLNVPHDTINLLRAPKYLVGSSMTETNLKRKSMIARKSESLNERLML